MTTSIIPELAYGVIVPSNLLDNPQELEELVNDNYSSLVLINTRDNEYIIVLRSTYKKLLNHQINFITDITSRAPSFHEFQDIIKFCSDHDIYNESKWMLWFSDSSHEENLM